MVSKELGELRTRQYVIPRDGEIPVNEREVWRYAGYFGIPENAGEELREVFQSAVSDGCRAAAYRVCWRSFSIEWQEGKPALPFEHESKGLARFLEGCCEGVMFAATVGAGYDRLIQRTQRTDTAKALLLQALGAERAESLCDRFCADMEAQARERGMSISRRYSPGYGDLPLEIQRDFFRLLEPDRLIGISLGESLLMTPSKSVTAVFGLRPGEGRDESGPRCLGCTKTDCEYRH